MNVRASMSGVMVVAVLAGLTATNAVAQDGRAAPITLAGLSSTDRTPKSVPPPPPPSPPPQATFDVVDPALVGTWEIMVTKRGGRQARWIWQITGDGAYKFHAEPFGAAPPHEGTMTAANGQWTLHALKGLRNWSDGGSYELHDTIAVITGKLGTGAWKRSFE
jgi:hypothetical protein